MDGLYLMHVSLFANIFFFDDFFLSLLSSMLLLTQTICLLDTLTFGATLCTFDTLKHTSNSVCVNEKEKPKVCKITEEMNV